MPKKIIVDADCTQHCNRPDVDGKPVVMALLSGKLILCLCDELKKEIFFTPLGDIYRELALAGLVSEVKGDSLTAHLSDVHHLCRSNDHHVIATARATDCRLLFSHDRQLHKDFTNLDILPRPQGKVYQTHHHAHLLD